MADINEYKCPACGGTMEFDSSSQKMKCPYCDTEMSIEAFEKLQEEQNQEENQKAENNTAAKEPDEEKSTKEKNGTDKSIDKSAWTQEEKENMVVYVCESCGGEITADKNTGATTCPFCGNRVVMKGQFEGSLKPDYIIPFKLDKKAAKKAYYDHLTGKAFIPSVFRQENHIDEIVGVYVPFWLFDTEAEAHMMYEGEKVRIWESGDTEYTEHEYFQMERGGKISFAHIPEDGSRKMDDALMESIEPYQFGDAVPFKKAYLAGYVADRYDVEQEECLKRAKKRMKRSAEEAFGNTVIGYQAVRTTESNLKVKHVECSYALYPVWILNTTWKGEKYVFAMNGQTGKMVGDLPADQGAFWKFVATRGVILGVILYIVMWIMTMI